MRKLSTLFAALGLVALVGGQASAAVLPVNGTLQIALGTLGGPSLTGSGIGSSSGGVNAPMTIPAGLVGATANVSVAITPPALGLSLIQVEASPTVPLLNDAGAFGPLTMAPLGGNFGGAAGNNGFAALWAAGFVATTSYYSPPTQGFTCGPGGGVLPTNPGCLAGGVPLKYIGGGGMGNAVVAGLPVTVVGAIWSNLGVNATTPTKVVKIVNAAAGIPVTITATAYDKRTAGGAGTVQLVAPVNAKLNGGLLGTLPVVGILTLQFVPEPGTLLLVGSGIVGLVAFGRKRARA
jgi:hypothetical protein